MIYVKICTSSANLFPSRRRHTPAPRMRAPTPRMREHWSRIYKLLIFNKIMQLIIKITVEQLGAMKEQSFSIAYNY